MYERHMRMVAAVSMAALLVPALHALADDRTTAKLDYDQAEALRTQGKWAEAWA